MKINGVEITKPVEEVVVIPRSTGDIIIKVKAVDDFSEFLVMCPPPLPKEIGYPDGRVERLVGDPAYKTAITEWSQRKIDWVIINALGLDSWKTVDSKKPETWHNCFKELNDSFFDTEVSAILDTIFLAAGLTSRKIEEATKNFLAGQGAKQVG